MMLQTSDNYLRTLVYLHDLITKLKIMFTYFKVMHQLLKSLLDQSDLEKIILIGDPDQGSSNEAGNAFEDIICGLQERRMTIEMKNNHRSTDYLWTSAKRIINGRMPSFDR